MSSLVSPSRARPDYDWYPAFEGRLEVCSTARRWRALVNSGDARVVLGVLGYDGHAGAGRAPAGELVARARTWLACHDPDLVHESPTAEDVSWVPDPDAVRAYHQSPGRFRRAFSAFCLVTRPLLDTDSIAWQAP